MTTAEPEDIWRSFTLDVFADLALTPIFSNQCASDKPATSRLFNGTTT